MYDESMAKKMPPEVLEYLRTMGKVYGKLGGKTAAKNLTPEQRSARAKTASLAAAKKRTEKRLAAIAKTKRAKKTIPSRAKT
jgi:hypothetical protein